MRKWGTQWSVAEEHNGGTDWRYGFRAIYWDITHRCNKICPLCAVRVQQSADYSLTWADYQYVQRCIGNPKEITSFLFNGGEPLLHPHFTELVRSFWRDYPNAELVVRSNGHLLRGISPEIFEGCRWLVTHYEGWNDWLLEWAKDKANIEIAVVRPYGHDDPDVSGNFPEWRARELRDRCWHMVALTGKEMYACGLGEPTETAMMTECVHMSFDKNWRENWFKVSDMTWKACQVCYEGERKVRTGG
jgi:organic radical activating enzyme